MANEIRLRDVEQSDLPIFFQQQRDPEANQMANFPARDEAAFNAHWAKLLADQTNSVKTILYGENVAGNIGCWQQSGDHLIGYWIGREYWGRGIATQALSEFLKHIQVRPLLAHVAKHNLGSIRVLEKCGFKFTATDKVTDAGSSEVEEYILKLTR